MYSDTQEKQVRELLATETDSIALANKLFGPGGAFAQMANDEQQRRALTKTPLFKLAQQRLSELRFHDATAFARVVEQFEQSGIGAGGMLKLERT